MLGLLKFISKLRVVGRGGQIRIVDNGIGMNSDDLLMAVERHATSKLKNSDDLFSLHTLGFRGEALPSIASISKCVFIVR